MATLQVDYDSVQVLYKMNPDGETAQMLSVLGKKAYDNAVADGWQLNVPKLNYPGTLYKPDGSTKIVQNSAEERMAEAEGWNHTVTAAPAPPPENYGPLVEPKSGDVDLALALLGEQEKRHAIEGEMAELKRQNQEILMLLRQQPVKGKPGRKPNPVGGE